nr:MAG TPA: hypothetical protein [Caudoviricetes sp.]
MKGGGRYAADRCGDHALIKDILKEHLIKKSLKKLSLILPSPALPQGRE